MSLVSKLVSKRAKREKRETLKRAVGLRFDQPPKTLDDVPERSDIDTILAQAETAMLYDSTRCHTEKTAERPRYVGTHWYYPWIYRVSVVLAALDELRAKKSSMRKKLYQEQYDDLFRVVQEAWQDRNYNKAITAYFKHGHILGRKAAKAWKDEQRGDV